MKKVLIAIEVKELPGEDLDLSHAVADVTLYPNLKCADDYSTRIGRWFYAKVKPFPTKKVPVFDPDHCDMDEEIKIIHEIKGYNRCIYEIETGETE